jgi:hypothetical protein
MRRGAVQTALDGVGDNGGRAFRAAQRRVRSVAHLDARGLAVNRMNDGGFRTAGVDADGY